MGKGEGMYMVRPISIGKQSFEYIRKNHCFYIDKTDFIREWWESCDDVTLITRPRRFGKTLNMDMLNCFFSNQYADRGDLFEGLSVWADERYHALQGSYPVIFLSFAAVKSNNIADAKNSVISVIFDAYQQHSEQVQDDELYQALEAYTKDLNPEKRMANEVVFQALRELSRHLFQTYQKKVLILLDEYDTPMQEAYVNGYWTEFTDFIRSLFNATFKTNPYLERAIMTGITRISKESIFSDLNNPNVITTTSEEYATTFGFTEQEVFEQLDVYGMGDKKDLVKKWYDGFIFGSQCDIYNPWSITNFLDKKQFRPYWASTSSNRLVNQLIRQASADVKEKMEILLGGGEIVVNFDEQIVFEQLDQNETAIWSLLLASGYLKAKQVEYRGEFLEPWYHLCITNLETRSMFQGMFKGWFDCAQTAYRGFIQALIEKDLDALNYYMKKITLEMFSYFDVADTGDQEPERFYHGFVLGLLADQRENYEIHSNRESGFGRYDVMMIPRQKKIPAIVMEFKVKGRTREKTLEETVQMALQQIREKQYDTELINRGIPAEKIYHLGFAFDGKNVLVGSDGIT